MYVRTWVEIFLTGSRDITYTASSRGWSVSYIFCEENNAHLKQGCTPLIADSIQRTAAAVEV